MAVTVSASHRDCSPPFCLAGEKEQSSNQQRTFPPETSTYPSRAPAPPPAEPVLLFASGRSLVGALVGG